MDKQESTFKREQEFLCALSELLCEHEVAISSFERDPKSSSEVVFQFTGTEEGAQHNFHTGRLHNSGYEIDSFFRFNSIKKTEPAFK